MGYSNLEPKRERPPLLRSKSYLCSVGDEELILTVGLDAADQPFEVFGRLGTAGSLVAGLTELTTRLVSLHLQRSTPIPELIEQCRGIEGLGTELENILKQWECRHDEVSNTSTQDSGNRRS